MYPARAPGSDSQPRRDQPPDGAAEVVGVTPNDHGRSGWRRFPNSRLGSWGHPPGLAPRWPHGAWSGALSPKRAGFVGRPSGLEPLTPGARVREGPPDGPAMVVRSDAYDFRCTVGGLITSRLRVRTRRSSRVHAIRRSECLVGADVDAVAVATQSHVCPDVESRLELEAIAESGVRKGALEARHRRADARGPGKEDHPVP